MPPLLPADIHRAQNRYTKGLRFPPAKWTDILDSADCRVLSVMSNSDVDVYLLAESSLIVYKDRVMLKVIQTGTTTTTIQTGTS